jgi:hypothetical protein
MSDDGIRSFRIEIPQAEIDYLHDGLRNAPLARDGRPARRPELLPARNTQMPPR